MSTVCQRGVLCPFHPVSRTGSKATIGASGYLRAGTARGEVRWVHDNDNFPGGTPNTHTAG
jgi:hypothetical protein